MAIRSYKEMDVEKPNGDMSRRRVGSAIITIGNRSTIDDVVFAEPGDAMIIGWRTLSGLNLEPDGSGQSLVDRGPIPAAAVA
jgi:hypothetical protein